MTKRTFFSHARFSRKYAAGLAAAAAALLSASAASAQTASPYYSFSVNNLTSTDGSNPAFPVYDSVNLDSLQINETFADSFVQTISLGDLQTQDTAQSSAQLLTATGGGAVSDPIHGALSSATLTGTLAFPGIPSDGSGILDLTIQPTSDPTMTYEQNVFTSFSASLFGPATTGIGVGTFNLLDANNNAVDSVNLEAVAAPAAVPEASTTVSLGLLLALGLGGLAVSRRRRSLAN